MRTLFVLILINLIGGSYGLGDKNKTMAKVTKVIDGNTVEIVTESDEVYEVMLKQVDCPELAQDFGAEAKLYTEKMLLKKKVLVEMKGKDMWGNRLVGITLKNGKNIEKELLEEGFAWHNTLLSRDQELAAVEKATKAKKRGLWRNQEAMAPWIFRRQQSMTSAKSH